MKKTRTLTKRGQGPTTIRPTVTVEMPLPMLAAMTDVRESFHALCIDAGRHVLGAMMEQDRTALCGPKWQPDPDREAVRAGSAPSLIVLGGRRIEMKRLRVRSR